ncbi:MAG TPA: (2Fe-2S)-binding protein [Geobacteraceae bacterium]|nr:(2Fe-2S)-binding protein [Geobacteraceae bacterium]
MIALVVNGNKHLVDVAPDTPLLWVIREELNLTGTKYGCGEGLCGSCTVLFDGVAVRSCQIPVKNAQGKRITTIEGLPASHPVKKAWLSEEVSQCGWCQPGQIMAATALLREKPKPTEAEIDTAMESNICRCGSYRRIRAAIHAAVATTGKGGGK